MPEIGLWKVILRQWWSNGGSSVDVNCELVTTKRLGKVRCLTWVEVRIWRGFNPINLTVISNFSSVEVLVSLVGSRLRLVADFCRLLFFCLQEGCDISDLVQNDLIFEYTIRADKCREQE